MYFPDLVKCSKCSPGHIPYFSGQICENEIENCKIGDSTISKTCKICKELYALSVDSKSCLNYAVEDCETYDSSAIPQCSKCSQGYTIDSSKNL